MSNNRISTPGYFLKRLRDAGFITIRVFCDYAPEDTRKWTLMVSPGKDSVMITCLEQAIENSTQSLTTFKIDDGGLKWPANYYLRTNSVNVVIRELIEREISMEEENSKYFKKNEN